MDQSRKKTLKVDGDRLSSLPDDCIQAILLCLPFRDAVRTSILSRTWRYQWMSLPQLVFADRNLFLKLYPREKYNKKLVEVINRVIILHRGPISKFKLCSDLNCCVDIDIWIHFLSRNGIKELILDNSYYQSLYKVPSCLFLSKEICHLELRKCTLYPPSSFNGFLKLDTLDLHCVSISSKGLENLITNSPLLKNIKLINILDCTYLKLCAPNLVDLEIESEFQDICCEATPVLDKGSSESSSEAECQSFPDGTRCKLVNIILCLSGIRRLALLGNTYQVISKCDVPVNLRVPCQLRHLSLNIEAISNKSNTEISIEEFWGAQEDFSYLFSQLRFLRVTEYSGTASQLKFIGFVLANAPFLQMVQVNVRGNITIDIYSGLIEFRRLSSKAGLRIMNSSSHYTCCLLKL